MFNQKINAIMKKFLLSLILFATFGFAEAQTNVFFDNFESYETGQQLKKILPDGASQKYKANNVNAVIAEGSGANGSSKYVEITPKDGSYDKIMYIKAYPLLENFQKGKDYTLCAFVKNTNIMLYTQMLITYESGKKYRANSTVSTGATSWTKLASETFYYNPDSTITEVVLILKSLDSTSTELSASLDDLTCKETDHQPMAPKFINIPEEIVVAPDSTRLVTLRVHDMDSDISEMTFDFLGDAPDFMSISDDILTITPTYGDIGQYTITITVTDQTNLSDTTSIIVNIEDITGIVDNTVASLTVMPNPSINGIFNIESDRIIKNVNVFNLVGQLVYQQLNVNSSKATLNIGNKKGVYFINIVSNNGQTQTVKAIIK